ncbi:carbamoyl phosphate synthase small subunit [Loigolactobacillus jiayinensis]|uniref:Carbamoyl phosphate synthase small chain n=1 Tax=Loigolactobacillus jiayinensis TaxID=2486016 RepID=A0ABW1RG17_9LACO|nr:carbamoyl phosphate synthase small subunit [Loigolactobacillus jiayinensis]
MKSYLILEDGLTFAGDAFGAHIAAAGEVVFNTGMTGYQEAITDPSYSNQLITFTYPLIGNYGIDATHNQSVQASCAAVIVRQLADLPNHYAQQMNLDAFLQQQKVPGIQGIDTRQLTKHIRQHGTLKAILTTQPLTVAFSAAYAAIKQKEAPLQRATYTTKQAQQHVVLIDFGTKKAIIDQLLAQHCNVDVVPYTTSLADIDALQPDGIFLSNGPDDPADYEMVLPLIQALQAKYPLAGICLGHQLLALANGAKTYKLQYGHRGLNHPVKNIATGKTILTSQNHGYAVAVDSLVDTPLEMTAYELNDGSVEGLQHKSLPVISVQYHPEANPGPTDALGFFTEFYDLMNANKAKKSSVA